MNDLNLTDEELIPIDTACNICGQPLRIFYPRSLQHAEIDAALSSMTRIVAHEECVNQRISERRKVERAEQVAKQIEARNKYWAGICPPEFQREIEWKLCRRSNYDRIMEWRYGPKGLAAYGPTGRCKTRFVYKLLKREHDAGRSIIALRHQQLRMTISRLASDDQVALGHFMGKLVAVDILFVDDLGKGTITPSSEEALSEVIDHRATHEKPIFFTTNDTFETLKARLSPDRGGPIVRKILDHCVQIAFD